ncbi:MAG: Omp28 family outer membrane lipoprotein [Bacteroidia bacterium]
MKISISLYLALTIAAFSSCDKVEGPFGNTSSSNGGGDTTVQIIRKVLIEDFTGHTCGNCPRAAESLNQIENLYGNQVVAIAVHAGFFAEPTGTFFSTDYRTTIGNDLDVAFGNSAAGLPNGLINRKSYDGQTILQHTDWASKTSEWINLPPEASIRTTPTFDEGSRQLSISVKTTFLQQIDESLNIVYYLTEDSIQSAQKDYDLDAQYDPNYYHRHVLRGSINGAWGQVLGDGVSYTSGEELTTNVSYSIPANWNSSKVAVVAILYKTSNNEVVQVEETKIQ